MSASGIRRVRQRLAARWARLRRFEYWPAWAVYLPVVVWAAMLGVRHRSVLAFTAANPGIEGGGGIVGESKIGILRGFVGEAARRCVLPAVHLPRGGAGRERAERARELMAAHEPRIQLPVVVKPDMGARGFAVRLARTHAELERALGEVDSLGGVIVQAYHAGPEECGIVWVRRTDGEKGGPVGRIFSVTRKTFPEVVGDGVRTLEELIWDDGRLRCQAGVFAERFAGRLGERPTAGERVRLSVSGNHCQGTMFTDGAELITPELEAAIDAVCAGFIAQPGREGAAGMRAGEGGLDFGRLDVRYQSDEQLRRGEGFAIIELNGTSAESTNMYDPRRSVWWSYRVLLRQWRELYRVGAWRLSRGGRTAGVREILRVRRDHLRWRRGGAVSD